MKIMQFIASLLPTFDRQRVINNIAALQSELGGSLVKTTDEVSATIGKNKPRSEYLKGLDKAFRAQSKAFRSSSVVEALATVIKSLPEKLGFLETEVSSNFSKDVARDALTYQKASVLKYLEVTEFFINYAERLLLKIMEAETCAVTKEDDAFNRTTPPALQKWMDDNQRGFFEVMEVLALPLRDVKEQIQSIPDITAVPDNVEMVQQTVGASKLDPMGLGFLITTWANPIYKLRMNIAEWQVQRYHAKQELLQALQFRLLALQESYKEKRDPRLEKAIAYHEARVNDLTRKLAETESEYTA